MDTHPPETDAFKVETADLEHNYHNIDEASSDKDEKRRRWLVGVKVFLLCQKNGIFLFFFSTMMGICCNMTFGGSLHSVFTFVLPFLSFYQFQTDIFHI